MKIVILCKKDGDPEITIPIMNEDRESMAVFESWTEARNYADESILGRISEVIFVDIESATARF